MPTSQRKQKTTSSGVLRSSFHERVAERLALFERMLSEPRCLRKLQIKSVVPRWFSLSVCVCEHERVLLTSRKLLI